MLGRLLPRHLEIIYLINYNHMEVRKKYICIELAQQTKELFVEPLGSKPYVVPTTINRSVLISVREEALFGCQGHNGEDAIALHH